MKNLDSICPIGTRMHFVLNDDGSLRECTLSEHMEFRSKHGVCRIGQTTVGDVLISTVFLGLNHGGYEKPVVFETFMSDMNYHGDVMVRYSTLQEAREGHKKWVEKIEKERGLAAKDFLNEGDKLFSIS